MGDRRWSSVRDRPFTKYQPPSKTFEIHDISKEIFKNSGIKRPPHPPCLPQSQTRIIPDSLFLSLPHPISCQGFSFTATPKSLPSSILPAQLYLLQSHSPITTSSIYLIQINLPKQNKNYSIPTWNFLVFFLLLCIIENFNNIEKIL